MGAWIIEVPFIVILLKLAIYLAGRTSNLFKSVLGVAALYAIPKTLFFLMFGAEVAPVVILGIVEFIVALIYFFLVLKLYDKGALWWIVTILGALLFIFSDL